MQAMGPAEMGYDRVVTIFSPDGRLFQVQYAMEAVKRGATVVGIRGKDCVVLAADKRITTGLMIPSSVEKVYKIDEHIAIATSGLVADGRKLVDEARVEAQRNRIVYGEPVEIVNLVRFLCDMSQIFTQYGGIRPFGVSLLVAGVNDVPRLYETDPSGTPTEWKAAALGEGRNEIMDILEKEHKDNLPEDECILLALKAMGKVMKKKIDANKIEVAVVTKSGFKKLDEDELNKYLEKARK